jgi:hypothetical protein
VYTRKTSPKKLLTSSGETVDAWASRETSVSFAFFERLRLQVAGIFLTEALVTLSAISCSAGASAVTGEVEGAAVVSFGGSSSSLQKEDKLCITRQKEDKYGAIEELEENTYDARRSKYSMSPTGTEALSAAAFCREELKEANSSTRFLFLLTPMSSASTGGGDVDELVSSSDSSASSLS